MCAFTINPFLDKTITVNSKYGPLKEVTKRF